MRNKLAILPIFLLIITTSGCSWTDFMLATPKGQQYQRDISVKENKAYVLGENRGFLMFVNAGEADGPSEIVARRALKLIDAEISRVKSATEVYSTGRINFILRACGIEENDAQVCVEELNSVLNETILLSSVGTGVERRSIIQLYYDGFHDGMRIAITKLDRMTGVTK